MYRGSSRDLAFRPPDVVSGQESLPHATRGPAEREHECLFLGRGHVMASFFFFVPLGGRDGHAKPMLDAERKVRRTHPVRYGLACTVCHVPHV